MEVTNLEQQPAAANPTVVKVQKPTAAFVLSLIAGILVLIQGVVRLLQGAGLESVGIKDKAAGKVLVGAGIAHLGGIVLLIGALILVGAIIMYKTSMILAGALVVLVFSILSIVSLGLFGLLGFIIGIAGSVVALARK